MALPHRHHHCCHLRGHVHYNGVLVQALAVTVERSAQHFQRKCKMHVALNFDFHGNHQVHPMQYSRLHTKAYT